MQWNSKMPHKLNQAFYVDTKDDVYNNEKSYEETKISDPVDGVAAGCEGGSMEQDAKNKNRVESHPHAAESKQIMMNEQEQEQEQIRIESASSTQDSSQIESPAQSFHNHSQKQLNNLNTAKDEKQDGDLLSLKDRISIMQVVADHKIQEYEKKTSPQSQKQNIRRRQKKPLDDHGDDSKSIAGSIAVSIAGSTSSLHRMVKSVSKRLRHKIKHKKSHSQNSQTLNDSYLRDEDHSSLPVDHDAEVVIRSSPKIKQEKRQSFTTSENRTETHDLNDEGLKSFTTDQGDEFFDSIDDSSSPEYRSGIFPTDSTNWSHNSYGHFSVSNNDDDDDDDDYSLCSDASSVSMSSIGTGSISSWPLVSVPRSRSGKFEETSSCKITFEPTTNLVNTKKEGTKKEKNRNNDLSSERSQNEVSVGSYSTDSGTNSTVTRPKTLVQSDRNVQKPQLQLKSERNRSLLSIDVESKKLSSSQSVDGISVASNPETNHGHMYSRRNARFSSKFDSITTIPPIMEDGSYQNKKSSSSRSLRSSPLGIDSKKFITSLSVGNLSVSSSQSADDISVASSPETKNSRMYSRRNSRFTSKFESPITIPTIMENDSYQNRDSGFNRISQTRQSSLSTINSNENNFHTPASSKVRLSLSSSSLSKSRRKKQQKIDPVSELDFLLEAMNLNRKLKKSKNSRRHLLGKNSQRSKSQRSVTSSLGSDRSLNVDNADTSLGIRPTITRDKSQSTKSSSSDNSDAMYKYLHRTPQGRTAKKYSSVRSELKKDDFDDFFDEIYAPLIHNNKLYRENQYQFDISMYGAALSNLLGKAQRGPIGLTSPTNQAVENEGYEDDNKTLLRLRLKSMEVEYVRMLRRKYGFPAGLARKFHRFSVHQIILRFWIVDNSGSMATKDGRLFSAGKEDSTDSSKVPRGRVTQMMNCTRWEELSNTVVYHGKIASDLGAPTIFRFVNDPNIARKQYMIEDGLPTDEYDNIPQVLGVCARSAKTKQEKVSTKSRRKKPSISLKEATLSKILMLTTRKNAKNEAGEGEPQEWEGSWELDYGLYDSTDDKWKQRANNDYEKLCHVLNETEPRYKTPLSGQIWAVFDQIKGMQHYIREGQEITIVIATDGIPDDADAFLDALHSEGKLPVQLIVRLCTDDLAATHFWSTLDLDVNISVKVLDDFEAEASAVNSMNPWLNYCISIQRMRESGYIHPLVEKLREERLSLDDIHDFCALLFGVSPNILPHPKTDWDTFYYDIEALNYHEKTQWNPLSKSRKKWIDMKIFAQVYGGSREKARKKKLKKLMALNK